MARLFDREAVVVVDGLRLEGLRVAFRVEKSLDSDPNTLDLGIYNLSAESRARVQKKGAAVYVLAGYKGAAQLIFAGEVRTGDHLRQGPDWLTRLQSGDGDKSILRSNVSESFAPGTKRSDVARRILGQMGVDPVRIREQLKEGDIPGALAQFTGGYAAFGKASRQLSTVLTPAGLTWSFQDGQLVILKGAGTTPGQAVQLTPDTGLVGSPEFGTPDKAGGTPVIKARSLLLPTLLPGSRVQLESERHRGLLRVEKVVHGGDTAGGEWYTDMEARAL